MRARLEELHFLPSWLKATEPRTSRLYCAGRIPCQHRGGHQHSTVHSGVHAWALAVTRRHVSARSTHPAPAPQVDCVFTHANMPTRSVVRA